MKRESDAKQALRRKFANGETVYVTEFAETYGIRTQTAMDYCKQLSYERVCKRNGTYYGFSSKGHPQAYAIWVPVTLPSLPIAIDEQPRVDIHPNVTFVHMYM